MARAFLFSAGVLAESVHSQVNPQPVVSTQASLDFLRTEAILIPGIRPSGKSSCVTSEKNELLSHTAEKI
jgi:hypothetical protein